MEEFKFMAPNPTPRIQQPPVGSKEESKISKQRTSINLKSSQVASRALKSMRSKPSSPKNSVNAAKTIRHDKALLNTKQIRQQLL